MKKTTTNIHNYSRKYTKTPDIIFHCADRGHRYLRERTYTICTPSFIRVKAQSHYDAGRTPVRDPESTGMNQNSTGINRGSTGDDRGKPGLNRESIKKFNTSWMNQASPRRTGNDRRGTRNI
ncbi:hypothetical protein DPMN_186760 [Dreissena polymorpha]|uniref:Uncharacterized protein n=1 Tax=Dreissena polymorpha TaxID=45954 RepID=A0A9D4DNF1_DREPO|nr:hypothetical protein DPMN_186760 [Dreissena polymorpha]